MLAFHNDPAIKEKYLARVRAHAAADEIEKGIYWKNGRGCAVGCTLHSSDHKAGERELGIPEVLWRLQDRIFEGLPLDKAKELPERFLSVIRVGADLSHIWPQFAVWLLTDPDHGVIRFADDTTRPIVQRIADWYAGPMTDSDEIRAARAAAEAAAWAARSAAEAAAWAVAEAVAEAAAWAVAEAVAAEAAAEAAADAVAAEAAAVWATESRKVAYLAQSEKLIEFLAAA